MLASADLAQVMITHLGSARDRLMMAQVTVIVVGARLYRENALAAE